MTGQRGFREPDVRVLAIIPARGGSKGIPRKNLQLVGGKPLIVHSIECALGAPSVDRVIVSTDDEEIGKMAQDYGAEVIWRPAEISGDTALSESALVHALDFLRNKERYEPDLVVFLQATSPLRRPEQIDEAVERLLCENADSLFSACRLHGFVWRVTDNGVESLSCDYRRRPRRQEAPVDLIENGSIYVFKPWVLRKFNNRLGGKITYYEMSPLESFQIDELEDLELMARLLPVWAELRGTRGTNRKAESLPWDRVRLLVLDFDGVLTDNRVLVDETGKESVFCNRSDGLAISMLKSAGICVIILSTETNPVVQARCRKLGVECVQGLRDKLEALKRLAIAHRIERQEIAYVGNDVNDAPCLAWVGLPIVVKDAALSVIQLASYVTRTPGGGGVVHELATFLLRRFSREHMTFQNRSRYNHANPK